MLGNCKAAIKLVLLLAWLAFGMIPLFIAYKLKKYHVRDWVMSVGSSVILKILGIRVHVTGSPAEIRPLLLVSNHITYLDIWVLNSKAYVHFTPKIEISKWPFIRSITNMSGSVYVERQASRISDGRTKLAAALAKGEMICLFPEATTGNGLRVLPYKSSFFSLTEEPIDGKELTVQPIAITYSYIRGLPVDTTQWPNIAWYGDMELMPHLWNLLKMTPIDAELVFLSPTTLALHGDRKKLAAHCQKLTEEAIETLRGRQRHAPVKKHSFNPRSVRVKD